MFAHLGRHLAAVGRSLVQRLSRRLMVVTKPKALPLVVGTLADLPRSKPALIAENALLRHQLAILRRGVKRPRCTPVAVISAIQDADDAERAARELKEAVAAAQAHRAGTGQVRGNV